MERYIGLDVHAQSCTMAVVGASGKRLRCQVVETNGKALIEAISGVAGDRYICLEEGTQSAWLYELLEPYAKQIVVTVADKHNGPKDDARDAWGLAEKLRIGAIKVRVYKAPMGLARLRNAVRAHTMLIRDLVRVKNRIKAVYRGRGIAVDKGVYDPERRKQWLGELPPSHRRLAECLGKELDALVPLVQEAEDWMCQEASAHQIARILETAPGMGSVRTAQVIAIVGTPHRFRTRAQFWNYCGFGVVTRSSSDWVFSSGRWIRSDVQQTRGLNRKHQPMLKAVFKGAATTMIGRMPKHPMHQDYQRMLASGIKPNLAKLTLARRIAAAVLSMWKHKEVYDSERCRITKKA